MDKTGIPLPRPPHKPFVGNLLDLDLTSPVQSLITLAREMGPIFEMDMMGKPFTVVWGFSLVDELCNERRFDKSVRGALRKVRAIAGDGLFTAYTSEPNWSKAHNILLPNFGERAMQRYHPMMLDVAEQMVLKWERLNADDEIDVTHDMTALTLDTIGLCGFGYRFNSFYREDNHAFINAMVDALEIAMSERGYPFEEFFTQGKERKLKADARYMNALVDRIIAERKDQRNRSDRTGAHDLLDDMLDGVDRKSGERLDDENIRYQIITFLIAGHETTSGMLSFAIYFMLTNPDVLERAYAEVDRVFGTDVNVRPTGKMVNQLTFVQQILKESLRLWPTAPAFALRPYDNEVIGGKYLLRARSQIMVLLPMLHRDPAVWGDRADAFDPENFSPEAEAKRPVNAYKPFGNGQRACIGRQFALHEATLVLGMILQRFRLIDHSRYKLRVKETLTLKPDGLRIAVRPRVHMPTAAQRNGAVVAEPLPAPAVTAPPADAPAAAKHGTPFLVLFGSNLGSSEDIARQVAEGAVAQGFAVTLASLDEYVGRLPVAGAVAIVTASYNGAPPDNAVAFYRWLTGSLAPGSLAGVKYTVFGAGNRNWASTYQSVPRTLDERLAEFGAQRLYARGEGDAREDLDGLFQAWKGGLWPALGAAFGLTFEPAAEVPDRPPYQLEFVDAPPPNPLAASHGAATMRVLDNRELQTGRERSTRHIEIELPTQVSFRAGDHLGVIPSNSEALVERALQRFGFGPNTYVRLRLAQGARIASLPLDATLSVRRLLMHYVELQAVATRKQVAILAALTRCPETKPELGRLASEEGDAYKTEIKLKGLSVLDLLEKFPACEPPFSTFLEMLPLMTPRYYSISSSPLAAADHCSITVGVVREPAYSGEGIFEGVCSTHLERRRPGARVNAFVKPSKSGFSLPADPLKPIVMVGPGTGLAPFRGFLQERHALKRTGHELGPALLFFGCRRANEDYIYREELERFESDGIVTIDVAFSRQGRKKTYVQHRIAERGDEVWSLLEREARVYVCGDGSFMEPEVRAAFAALFRARTGGDEAAATAWLAELTAQGRYVLDVWAAT
jgi:cytochrome P450/NADPH-cytochrome P450 reductase